MRGRTPDHCNVNNAISESIAGGSPGIGTVWVTSDIASIINVSNLAVADNTGTVYALRVDGTIGLNATLAATGYFQGEIKGPVSIVGLSGATATDPLVQGQTGYSNGRLYGFVGNTQRQFAPSAVRLHQFSANKLSKLERHAVRWHNNLYDRNYGTRRHDRSGSGIQH